MEGLRFYAVLMVMIAHWSQWQWTDRFFIHIPFVHGVTLFFVLSGYLITSILNNNRENYDREKIKKSRLIRNFYMRRVLRIFPIYYLLIIALFLFNYDNTRELFPWLVTYTTNIYQSIHNVSIGDFRHFWSLAVEEQFYLFWPFVILFVRPKKTLTVILITIVLSLIVRFYLYFFVGKWMATAYFTLSCMHALGLGALLAYIQIYQPKWSVTLTKPLWVYLAFGGYVVSLFIQTKLEMGWYKETIDEFLFAILAFFIISRASVNGFTGIGKRILENTFVTYSGRISYGMYIIHFFIPGVYLYFALQFGWKLEHKLILFILYYAMTFAAAYVSWKLIEQPFNSLKDKVPYR